MEGGRDGGKEGKGYGILSQAVDGESLFIRPRISSSTSPFPPSLPPALP